MKKIKVGFISFLAYPLFNSKANVVFGGAEVDSYTLARKLEQSGRFELTFYVGDFGQPAEEQYGAIRVRKIKYLNLEHYKGFPVNILRQLNIILEVLKSDCDVFFIEAYNEMLGWVKLLAGNLRGTKTIFRLAHDLDTDLTDARSKGFLYHFLYQYGIRHTERIVSQTDIQQEMLRKNLGRESQVVKNGFFINDEINYAEKKYILWVARAQDWKRPGLYLELVRRLPGEEFVMIMPGENDLQQRIKAEAAQLSNLRFINYVPFADVQKYYNGARLFVNTSEYEGFPNAFVQACLGKTPILSFNVNPDGFIGKNQLGYFCGNDLKRAAEFIRGFTPETLQVLGDNAMKYVKENHDISTLGAGYEEMIQSLAAGGQHRDGR